MKIFSKTYNAFTTRQKEIVSEKLLDIKFPDWVRTIYLYEDSKTLGLYNHEEKSIGLNKRLIFQPQEIVEKVLFHELAHYISMHKYSQNIEPHGKEFKEACSKLNIEAVTKLNVSKELLDKKVNTKEDEVLSKVKKLFELSNSDNENEAELALNRANQLLTKYNLSFVRGEVEEIYQDVITKQKRRSRKWTLISILLRDLYGVFPVWNQGFKQVTLEISGRKENIEISKYVANYLDKEMERLYKKQKDSGVLSGATQKNSYFDGLISQYIDSVKYSQNKNLSDNESHSLVLVSKEAEDYARKLIYGKLRSRSSYSRHCKKANVEGRSDSKNLKIRQGLNKNSKIKLLS
tara:strand:- start:11180 stop:12223 length:1044 start_codon:yes stop_codon:yes gene_type:complete